MRYAYPAALTPEPEGGFSVAFPDVPEARTQGDDAAEALDMAVDALVTALSFYVDADRKLPRPGAARGRPLVAVPALAAAKLALHEAMLARGLGTRELARELEADEKAVRRLRDLLHRSHIGQVEEALQRLGRRLLVEVADASA